MTTNPYIYPVPVGATIPAGTKYATEMPARADDFTQDPTGYPRFTSEPIPAPRPVPPTEPGTVLTDVTDGRDTCAVMFYHGGEWHGTDQDGDERFWQAENLVSWTVADVVPRKTDPDPLDENDHRDRVEARGIRLTRGECGRWHAIHLNCRETHSLAILTLASWAEGYGPLRFADEVQS